LWIQQEQGLVINPKAVLRLMHRLNIRSRARRRKMYRKFEELGIYHRYSNLLNRDFAATRPNQKWVTDITFVPTQQGWAYLSTIKDLFDGFIVAHQVAAENFIELVKRTLQQARRKEKVTAGLILHSDQGHQYTSHAYAVLIQK
jgi:transposase InsO family protein